MIRDEVVEAFNNRMTVDLNVIKKMSPAQLDKIKTVGSQAEALMQNRDFAQFVHQFKFEKLDNLAEVAGYTPEDDTRRIAISHQIAGIDEFVKSLKRAIYFRDRVVSQQSKIVGPDSILEE
jgi:prephenate dehydratase